MIDAAELKRRLPRDKDDAALARALVTLGYPAVDPVLPQMLDWLKAIDSPVERVLRPFFVSLGAGALPVVRKALASRHDLLKYALTANVVAHWPADAIAGVKTELTALATATGDYGTDLIALRLLVEHDLAERDWLREWSRFKTRRLREQLAQAEHIEAVLAR